MTVVAWYPFKTKLQPLSTSCSKGIACLWSICKVLLFLNYIISSKVAVVILLISCVVLTMSVWRFLFRFHGDSKSDFPGWHESVLATSLPRLSRLKKKINRKIVISLDLRGWMTRTWKVITWPCRWAGQKRVISPGLLVTAVSRPAHAHAA